MRSLDEIFLSYYLKERNRIYKNGISLAHYTNILPGYLILKSKEIWLRNITKMNDYMEVKWGLELFKIFLYDNDMLLYRRLTTILAKAHKDNNYWEQVIDELIDNFYEKYAINTYILSLTENINKNLNEDLFNKFCRDQGLIFVFNSNYYGKFNKILNLSRVAYFNGLGFKNKFIDFIKNIENNVDLIKKNKLENVEEAFKKAIFYAILSIIQLLQLKMNGV